MSRGECCIARISTSSRRKPTTKSPATCRMSSSRVPRLHDKAADRLAIYYGAADTSCCLAYAHLNELIAFTKENSEVF